MVYGSVYDIMVCARLYRLYSGLYRVKPVLYTTTPVSQPGRYWCS